jgi:hypothetical protein
VVNRLPVQNWLGFVDDVPNNEDEAKDGFVFENKDGELVGNKEPPGCPNCVVLVDDVNGFELGADELLNEVLNVLVEPKVVEDLANGLFVWVDGNGFGETWLNEKGFCCGVGCGTAAGAPEGFGPPASSNITNQLKGEGDFNDNGGK